MCYNANAHSGCNRGAHSTGSRSCVGHRRTRASEPSLPRRGDHGNDTNRWREPTADASDACAGTTLTMYLAYFDESGDSGIVNSPTRFFVLSCVMLHHKEWKATLDGLITMRR